MVIDLLYCFSYINGMDHRNALSMATQVEVLEEFRRTVEVKLEDGGDDLNLSMGRSWISSLALRHGWDSWEHWSAWHSHHRCSEFTVLAATLGSTSYVVQTLSKNTHYSMVDIRRDTFLTVLLNFCLA